MKIKIDGREYPFPDIDSLTLDEAIVLERQAGVMLEEILPGQLLPMGAIKGFVLIALMRGNPEASEREIAERIGKIKLGEIQELVAAEEADASPPDPVPSEKPGSDEISGGAGGTPSEPSPEPSIRLATGGPGSVTTSASDRRISAG